MNYKIFHRVTAGVVFFISTLVLILTVQPSVSFWDCGEFIAASYALQVPHPPGAPFFLLLGKLFSFIPFGENIAYRINMISVFSSSLSVLLLYLIAVKLIENYRGKEPKDILDAIGTYIAAAIGALSFSFSDTFWFNGVEAEVYAASTFLFALITYLMMLWNEKADEKDNEKYILMIGYLIGLSTGVHLMSVLAIISVVMVILFRKYLDDEEALKKSVYIFLGHAAVILVIAFAMWGGQKSLSAPSPEEYSAFDNRFKMIAAGISGVVLLAFRKQLLNRNSIYMSFIIGGIALFVTYPGIVKHLPNFLKAVSGDNITTALLILAVILGGTSYAVYWTIQNKKNTLHVVFMSLIFIFLGFATYAMVIIRANQDPPMNENEPKTISELVSYLNREQYGDFPTFKRRFSSESHQTIVYTGYSSDLDFWWRYQMHHMTTRYLLWNYAGRESWDQDAGVNIWPLNSVGNVIGKLLGIRFDGTPHDSLYGIPLLLGLLGIYFHFRRDWKMATVFMVLFIFMGYLTAFYQNQQQPQPRERDYFYVGAFFVFSIWIALGVKGLLELAAEKIKNIGQYKIAFSLILLFGIVFVPVRMAYANYHKHDRSQNWVPWDYSYNLLQSCAPNAILFTNGDNDTFPLWYLQDVEGVRRDVRVANLSLLNTPWYIKQLKNLEPYGAMKVKMRLSDAQISEIRPMQWQETTITLPVTPEARNMFKVTDTTVTSISFKMPASVQFGNISAVRVQDILVREIIESNLWDRPVYFAVTCSEDSKIGIGEYLRMEGMALRVVPMKRQQGVELIDEDILRQQVYNENPGYSKDYKPGFKFRGLNDPNIFFDENHQRLSQNYRNAFIRLALYYMGTGKNAEAVKALDEMEKKIPRAIMKIDYRLLFDVGQLYKSAGAEKQYQAIAKEVMKAAEAQLEINPDDVQSFYNPYRLLLETYENTGNYDKAVKLLERLQLKYPNDPSLKAKIDEYKVKMGMKAPADTSK